MDTRRHPVNNLNELTNREWLIETKSFWRALGGQPRPEDLTDDLLAEFAQWLADRHGEDRACEMLGQRIGSVMNSIAPPRDKLKTTHPATFSERDIERLIQFFTKSGEPVLDPFVGTGSTLLACHATGRIGVGIELIERWRQVALDRLAAAEIECVESAEWSEEIAAQTVLSGDALETLCEIPDEAFNFVVTSPPYWRILNKKGGEKTAAERTSRGLPTNYSDEEGDLGNIESYEEFLDRLGNVFAECGRTLAHKRYMCVIVSDFRHGPKFYLYHADVAHVVEARGLDLKGVTILIQDSKNLYPLGIPHAFVSNIHHQYVLIFQKL